MDEHRGGKSKLWWILFNISLILSRSLRRLPRSKATIHLTTAKYSASPSILHLGSRPPPTSFLPPSQVSRQRLFLYINTSREKEGKVRIDEQMRGSYRQYPTFEIIYRRSGRRKWMKPKFSPAGFWLVLIYSPTTVHVLNRIRWDIRCLP